MIQENYSKLLHTEEWRNKRLQILIRDKFQCTCCHKEKKVLYVHHKYYCSYPNGEKVMPWEYPNEALTTLCYGCHKHVHNSTRIVVRYIARN